MRNLKLTLAYDGTSFSGWQIQPGVLTVQGEIQRAVQTILNHDVVIHGSGRTDAGVHAHAQVANFLTEHSIEGARLLGGLNALLSPEIRILRLEEVPLDFQARLSAISKTYEYHVWRLPEVSPFRYRFVVPVTCDLDAIAMDRASTEFIGSHDFTSFCSADEKGGRNIRTVSEAAWRRKDEEWVFRIRANGFLRYMVRAVVGTLIDVGKGRIKADEIPEIFSAKDRQEAGPSAAARGLHLVNVEY